MRPLKSKCILWQPFKAGAFSRDAVVYHWAIIMEPSLLCVKNRVFSCWEKQRCCPPWPTLSASQCGPRTHIGSWSFCLWICHSGTTHVSIALQSRAAIALEEWRKQSHQSMLQWLLEITRNIKDSKLNSAALDPLYHKEETDCLVQLWA